LPRNRRLWAGLIPLGFFAGALVGVLITPRSFFNNPLYWLSVLWFGVVGGVLLGTTSRTSRIPRITSMGLSFFIVVVVLAERTQPVATMILYGLIGLFVGFGARIASFLYFETKWMYCDVCKRDYWHMRRNGVWECQRATHSFVHG
jgi:hypothetical protein